MRNLTVTAPERGASRLLWLAAVGLAALYGCADAAELAETSALPALAQVGAAAVDAGSTINPAYPYTATVTTNGTGCPAGTSTTSISADGQVFTTAFSSFVVELDPTVYQMTRDCTLTVSITTPENYQFTVVGFESRGFALIEQGMRVSTVSRYWFHGNPVPASNTNRVTIDGPADREIVFKDEIDVKDAVWSPCGLKRDLNVYERLQLTNGPTRGQGYAHIGNLGGTWKFRLAWRKCETPAAAPTLPAKN